MSYFILVCSTLLRRIYKDQVTLALNVKICRINRCQVTTISTSICWLTGCVTVGGAFVISQWQPVLRTRDDYPVSKNLQNKMTFQHFWSMIRNLKQKYRIEHVTLTEHWSPFNVDVLTTPLVFNIICLFIWSRLHTTPRHTWRSAILTAASK